MTNNKLEAPFQDEIAMLIEFDDLRASLAAIQGIPDREYEVLDANQVFVFDKLASDVAARVAVDSTQSLTDLATEILPSAYMSPIDAIEYGIVPHPYEVLETDGGLLIQHRVFKTFLPGSFATRHELNAALVSLLIGNIHEGNGDFIFKGQAMTNDPKLDTKLTNLPAKPRLETALSEIAPSPTAILSTIEYEEGFHPIDSALFNSIKSLESTWIKDINHTASLVAEKISDVWQLIQNLDLKHLQLNYQFDQDNAENISLLRATYPELGQLSDDSLYHLFDEYQGSFNYVSSWSVSREDDFALFVLGKFLSAKDLAEIDQIRAGTIIAWGLLQNLSQEQAVNLGKEWASYHQELQLITAYVAEVMQFLAADRHTKNLQGAKISYFFDGAIRSGRKFG